MTNMLDIAKNCSSVTKIAAWNDRFYVTLPSRLKGDLSTKIWIKGNVLTVQGGKGYRSDEFNAALTALEEAVVAAGAVRKGYSDSIDATYTIA